MKTWNLDALYPSFESESFQKDIQRIKELVEQSVVHAKEHLSTTDNALETLQAYLENGAELRQLLRRAYGFCSLTMSTDALNEDAIKYLNMLQVISAKTAEPSAMFAKWLPEVPNLNKLIADNEELHEIEFFLHRIVEGSKYVLSDKEESIISKLQQTGSTAWGRLQGELTSTLKVPYDGKEITLSEVRNLSSDPSQEVRKAAYEAEQAAYPQIAQAVAYAMNGVKGEVNTLSELRGFSSPLAQAVYNSRMQEETLEALIASMRKYATHFHKYLKRKASILGHKNGLPYYDIFAPVGSSDRVFTEEEAMEFIFENFRTFSPNLEALARRAWDEEWIDFTPRNGKRGGAFCSNLHPIKQSRILTNFTGSFGNVITLAHELGHAYHGDQIFKEHIFNSSYTMPVAETASTFCETIVKNAALKEANDEEKIFILEQSLKGSTQVIIDILSRYIFEQNVFDTRKQTPLNVRMLNDLMIAAQKEAYGDSLDPDYLQPYAWLNKPHYYRGGLSFYNFPYAFGLLFAKGIYAEFIKQGEPFVERVNTLLQKTGQMTVEDVASLVGIDLTSASFWDASLDVIVEEIELFLELTK
ncbi:M3 family oligoendopeptidase [Candidatus Xianfuyuplasma coldseepsis]|uniref:M3 family oligoendopeptidase n=1 Tax=Candidatus Xianfuyuplasma coldseepsis TaxID=2782163 RepID=A0A7L7KSQ0_9MOLU|nr:M3 family oligoendopeptidase [Xianfuyuplasma coldseepsis]QMS85773.1 M3 family oligoendopeptidase [Xianfuyuplasma coldseepsis]